MKKSMFRVEKDKDNPYVILNKIFLNDVNLSLKAKGMLAYFLSLPDDWQIYEDEVVKHHKDGKDSLKSAIKELMENGYIERVRMRDEKGRLGAYEYRVYEVSNQNGKSNIGKSNDGESATTNNNLTNNNRTNNKLLHELSKVHDRYILSYLEIMNDYGYKHKRVNTDNMNYIEYALSELRSNDIDMDRWQEEVYNHFNNLPESNDGDIVSFLKASRRYFDVQL